MCFPFLAMVCRMMCVLTLTLDNKPTFICWKCQYVSGGVDILSGCKQCDTMFTSVDCKDDGKATVFQAFAVKSKQANYIFDLKVTHFIPSPSDCANYGLNLWCIHLTWTDIFHGNRTLISDFTAYHSFMKIKVSKVIDWIPLTLLL